MSIWAVAQVPPPPPPMYGPAAPGAREKEGIFGLLAGIFMIIGALGLIGYGAWFAFWGTVFAGMTGGMFGGGLLVCGIIPLILGIIELVGAIYAFKRTNWAFALVGAIVGLNILAIIFLAVGKKEFH